MKIVELGEDGGSDDDCGGREIVPIKAKKALVGAGARILFYPTLLYNVFRSKIQAEFRWWDEVDQITPLQRVKNPCNCNASSAVRTLLHRERKPITWQLMLITWKALLMLTKVLIGVSRLYWGGKVSGPVCKVDRLRTKLKLHNKFLLLGAVPFRTDVPRLQQLGVQGVVTLNEPYETLVPSSLYQSHGIDHLVIPTRDYLFAPSLVDICRAVDFIHKNATCGRTTYVHCKAGRGRSTTIVLCYLVKYKHMTPAAALEYVRSIRPRVLLARTQWKAVQDFSKQKIASFGGSSPTCSPAGDAVLITEADLEGYYGTTDAIGSSKDLTISSHGNRIARARPMIARLACLFASLKVSGGSSLLVSHRLPEIRAC